jgi:hypothetical protein
MNAGGKCVSASVRECGSEGHTPTRTSCHSEAQARRTLPSDELRGPKDLACDTSKPGRDSATDAWASARRGASPGPGAILGAPHPQPFPRKLRGGRELVRRVTIARRSGGLPWRGVVWFGEAGAVPGCPLPRPLSRKRERGEFECSRPDRRTRLEGDAYPRGRCDSVREGGLRAVVAANSFAPAGQRHTLYHGPRHTPQHGPRPRLPCRCRAQVERHPRLDPTARVVCTAGRFGALGPLDDNLRRVLHTRSFLWANAAPGTVERANPGPGASRGAPHPRPFPRKLRGGREPVRRVTTARRSGGWPWRGVVRFGEAGAVPGCPLPRPLSRKRERGEFECARLARHIRLDWDAYQRGRCDSVREGGLRAVVAANSFAPAGLRNTPHHGPRPTPQHRLRLTPQQRTRPRLPCRCRARVEKRPQLDPAARMVCTAGRFGALGPLDDNVPGALRARVNPAGRCGALGPLNDNEWSPRAGVLPSPHVVCAGSGRGRGIPG